jgi:hypothetical protein
MSPVAIGLDLLLVALLVTAIVVGLRLNKRLKAVREGQAGFVKAVAELDAAAARAESGLKALRAASEETHDVLLTRIETARGLINRLEAASHAAERAADRVAARPPEPPPSLQAALGLARAEARLDPRFRESLALAKPAAPAAPVRRPAPRSLDDDLFEAEPAPAPAPRRYGLR